MTCVNMRILIIWGFCERACLDSKFHFCLHLLSKAPNANIPVGFNDNGNTQDEHLLTRMEPFLSKRKI